MHKTLIYISVIAILTIVGKWIYDSSNYGETLIFSMDKKAITVIEEDELFGNKTETTEWEDGFWLGLLPADNSISLKTLIGVLPLSSIFIIIIVITFIIHKKSGIKND